MACAATSSVSPNQLLKTSQIPPELSNLVIIRPLNKANFPVFLTYSAQSNSHFALKLFPFKNNQPNPFYLNESQFVELRHPNVIRTVHHGVKKMIPSKAKGAKASYIFMELAPYGDFFDLLITRKLSFNEKLARTYFHQLIEGIEYLTSKGVAHLDIKPENILLGKNYLLKIADFDHSSLNGKASVPVVGTANYRAPEVFAGTCKNLEAADIYSAAIMLFLFKTSGVLPHLEHNKFQDSDLLELLNTNNDAFWEKHCEIQEKPAMFFDSEFKALFNAMTKVNVNERATLADVKASEWYNGPIYTEEELSMAMREQF